MPTTLQPPSRLTSPSDVPQPLFALEVVDDGDTFLIRLRGELDLTHCPHLDLAFAESRASEAASVLLDLEELTFIEAAGLHSLCAASSLSAAAGPRLRMTPGRGAVAAILRLTALDTTLPFGTA